MSDPSRSVIQAGSGAESRFKAGLAPENRADGSIRSIRAEDSVGGVVANLDKMGLNPGWLLNNRGEIFYEGGY